MATIDRNDAVTERARFCPECGHRSDGANFCPGCGHNMGFAADRTLAGPSVQAASGGRKPRGRGGLIAAGGALGVAAIAVAAIIVLGSRSRTTATSARSPTVIYKAQLTKVLTPLVTANQTLSRSLTSLDGSQHSVRTTKLDTSQALSALSAARGGIAVLNAPSGLATLSGQVQQALTADNGYLQAVSSTLATPTGSGAGQLQTLATGAQSALNPLQAVASGAPTSVTGTDNLVSWVQGASRQAPAPQPKVPAGSQSSSATQSPTTPAAPPAPNPGGPGPGSVDCGGGLFAGPHTSCAFAANVKTAWMNTPGNTNTVTAYSPVTGLTYTENCGPSGGGIMCTGVGADNSIWWN